MPYLPIGGSGQATGPLCEAQIDRRAELCRLCPPARHFDPRLRTGECLCAAAQSCWQADHRSPGDRVQACGDGDKVETARLPMVNAARLKDRGERIDVEAGMAKLLASEYCAEVSRSGFTVVTAIQGIRDRAVDARGTILA